MPGPHFARIRRRGARRSLVIPGAAANRNRAGRTGLDPMDAYREQGYVLGWLIRSLFGSRFRTRKLVYLALMLFGGLFFTLPLLLIVSHVSSPGGELFISNSFSVVPWILIGLGLLFSFGVSLLALKRSTPGKSHEQKNSDRLDR